MNEYDFTFQCFRCQWQLLLAIGEHRGGGRTPVPPPKNCEKARKFWGFRAKIREKAVFGQFSSIFSIFSDFSRLFGYFLKICAPGAKIFTPPPRPEGLPPRKFPVLRYVGMLLANIYTNLQPCSKPPNKRHCESETWLTTLSLAKFKATEKAK